MHPAAEEELAEAAGHYESIDPRLSDAFVNCFEACKARITEHPLHYSVRKASIRRINLKPRFGEYYLPYLIWQDRVVILAVAHAKRRPWYWQRRIDESRHLF